MRGHDVSRQLRDRRGRWTVMSSFDLDPEPSMPVVGATAEDRAAMRSWLVRHPPEAKNVVDMWDKATPAEQKAGIGWYNDAHKVAYAMSRKRGISVEAAAGLLANYSPQKPWGKNQIEADTVARLRKGLGGKGSGIMATAAQAERANRILAGEDPEIVLGGTPTKTGLPSTSGMKIRSFYKLIAEGDDVDLDHPAVVVDRHAIGVARGIYMSENAYEVDGLHSSREGYAKYRQAYIDAAKKISARGTPVTPHQVQAATWLTRQRLNAAENTRIGKTRKNLGGQDWNNWVAYANEFLPELSEELTTMSATTGYADLSTPYATNPYAPYYEESRPQQKVHLVQPPPQDDGTITAIAQVLLAGYATAKTVELIAAILVPWKIGKEAISMALGLARRGTAHRPNARLSKHGALAEGQVIEVRDDEVFFRAAYLANASRRMDEALDEGKTVRVVLSEEALYYRQHERARAGRQEAAAQVQVVANVYGPILGWYLNPLLNNEAECIAANGHNFDVMQGTVIGLPGAVHANCGCYAGPPHQGAAMVNDVLGNVIKFDRRARPKFKVKRGKTA